ncbi:tRNA (adenosine(37)-N6)-threonylcarbamoyltransferase complex ATPase subunit type 1 TsaE [Marinomonas algicola]|jgi:tRNA threonylcarbamoyladenosine biosynthesis protein TsaE|uniref:tRNA (adenosine(37)-N6)-threonylcarbamoyltransferase complex ATPase subunit type 1 TsaE n=1 Tax=Marinomonas algicola TaxID=2773454 RepID=UPI00174CE8A7|nr:tRNA (adenosine(37)-N6)-threonylcarbamoyltransferase complex ATPase subunit type 1 TsaE [Marinomonas algicola]
MKNEKIVYGEEAMERFGGSLFTSLSTLKSVHFDGDLGMGKTTLVRGVLKGGGYNGPVKSPTYTLVEPYDVGDFQVFHFDLYRLLDPEELEYMGIRDYFEEKSLCLIEWPDKGKGILPEADLVIRLSLEGDGRRVSLEPLSVAGVEAVTLLQGVMSSE